MQNILRTLYKLIPGGLRTWLVKWHWFNKLKNRLKGTDKKIWVQVEKDYSGQKAAFLFNAPVFIAKKARDKGIENTILRNSLKLLSDKGVTGGAHVFDVGANFGYLSMVWATTVCKNGGHLYSFEPSPNVNESLELSIEKNALRNNVTLEKVMVGNDDKEVKMHFTQITSNINPIDKAMNAKSMKLIKLDSYMKGNNIPKLDLVKIDVDGIELEILRGAKEMLRKFSPILIVETNEDNEIMSYLRDEGYELFDMHLAPCADGELPQNVFCVKRQ